MIYRSGTAFSLFSGKARQASGPLVEERQKQRRNRDVGGIMKKAKLVVGLLLIGVLLYSWISGREGKQLAGKVVGVNDGDTVTLLDGSRTYKIRLDGIDCPELGQAFGNNAKQFTSEQVFGTRVTVYYSSKDRYKRYLGTVITAGGANLNRELLKAGLAWHYKDYSDDPILAGLEAKARLEKKGLWSDRRAIPPWEYRRRGRE